MKAISVVIIFAAILAIVFFIQKDFSPQNNYSVKENQTPTKNYGMEPVQENNIAQETIQTIIEKSPAQINESASFMDNYTANLAADNFFGFYFANTRARKLFCDQQGIDISNYVNIFADKHIDQYIKARSIYEKSKADEERVWEEIKDAAMQKMPDAMQKMADHFGITIEQACQLYAENAEDLANRMHYSNSFPDAYLTLMNTAF
jgi:hypothetical protein